jgi:hypothetical protein
MTGFMDRGIGDHFTHAEESFILSFDAAGVPADVKVDIVMQYRPEESSDWHTVVAGDDFVESEGARLSVTLYNHVYGGLFPGEYRFAVSCDGRVFGDTSIALPGDAPDGATLYGPYVGATTLGRLPFNTHMTMQPSLPVGEQERVGLYAFTASESEDVRVRVFQLANGERTAEIEVEDDVAGCFVSAFASPPAAGWVSGAYELCLEVDGAAVCHVMEL